MNKFLILVIIKIFFFSEVIAATANCDNGECKFTNSNHYMSAKTYCLQNLNFEDVQTEFLYFTILRTNEKCNVFEIVR